jgi:hypothetical protein
MKGLAIYTVIVFVALVVGLLSDFSIWMVIGMAALSPILVFAILYLVRLKKSKFCGNCGVKI